MALLAQEAKRGRLSQLVYLEQEARTTSKRRRGRRRRRRRRRRSRRKQKKAYKALSTKERKAAWTWLAIPASILQDQRGRANPTNPIEVRWIEGQSESSHQLPTENRSRDEA
jgi:hypothetical protein